MRNSRLRPSAVLLVALTVSAMSLAQTAIAAQRTVLIENFTDGG